MKGSALDDCITAGGIIAILLIVGIFIYFLDRHSREPSSCAEQPAVERYPDRTCYYIPEILDWRCYRNPNS